MRVIRGVPVLRESPRPVRVWVRVSAAACLALSIAASAPAVVVAADSWSPTGSMNVARQMHTATLLADGRVLVAGGSTADAPATNSAELYDPQTATWAAAGSMATPRARHTATLLANGKVLVVGGVTTALSATPSAELYDPTTNTWSGAGRLASARSSHTATLLPDGRVLVVGGSTVSPTASAELYDPSTNSWSPAASMRVARSGLASMLLPGPRVLVTGGNSGNGSIGSAEVYDVNANTWSPASSSSRYDHTMITLPSGQILQVGGTYQEDTSTPYPVSVAELYDPTTGSWLPGSSMSTPHWHHTATLLANGNVLVAGGRPSAATSPTAGAELYLPNNSWSSTTDMKTAREYHTATLLLSGKVLVAGGSDAAARTLASAELYAPGVPVELPVAPVRIAPPRVVGQAQVGKALSCVPGSWSGTTPISFAYRWLHGDTPLATGATYTPQSSDAGTAIMCEQTASNTAGSASAASVPVLIIRRPRSRYVVILATGRATPPGGVSRRRACRGHVRATLLKGTKLLARHRTHLNRRCAWRWRATLRRTAIGNATRLRLHWRFDGNTILRAATLTRMLRVPAG